MFDQVDALPPCETQTVHLYQSAAAAAAAGQCVAPVISQRYDVSITNKPTHCELTHGGVSTMSKPRASVATESAF